MPRPSPPPQEQDKWLPHEAAMHPPNPPARCKPPRKYPHTINRNNIPEPTYTLNTKQINDGIFSNRAGENFKLEKTFLNVRVQL